jgi:hypothetical protein
MALLRRFWFEFERTTPQDLRPEVTMGCGVSAYDYDDAVQLLRDRVFKGQVPSVANVQADVDVSTLDEGHVRPNMGNPTERGIWFPLGF